MYNLFTQIRLILINRWMVELEKSEVVTVIMTIQLESISSRGINL